MNGCEPECETQKRGAIYQARNVSNSTLIGFDAAITAGESMRQVAKTLSVSPALLSKRLKQTT